MEISCGDGPYLTSRYDTVTGNSIDGKDRIGLLDKKSRILSENFDNEVSWSWNKYCFKNRFKIY